jgi:Peptidase family M28
MPARLPTTAVLLSLITGALLCPAFLCPSATGQSRPASPARQDVAKSTVPAASNPAATTVTVNAIDTPASSASPSASAAAAGPETLDPATISTDTSLPPPADAPADAAKAKSKTLFFYTSPRSTLEMEVHSIPATNAERLERLRDDFAAADCGAERMRQQSVTDKQGKSGTNLICVWPGQTPGTIVIVAHYEHEGAGQGALADWSGAALLPFLYQAIQGQPRTNTYVFLEAWKREGADAWLKSLNRTDRKRIRAVIDLDALGLSYTRFFTTFSPFENVPLGATHLQAQLLWAALSDGLTQAPEQESPHHWLTVDPTDPFRALMVPTIVIHSVPVASARIPGSAADVASTVDGNAYFTTYHLMCAYLASLDRVAEKLDIRDPLWDTGPTEVQPESETPRVTFRTFSHGQLQNPPPTPQQ